jgi:hypothetical protein
MSDILKEIRDDGVLVEDELGRVWFYAMTPEQIVDLEQKLHAAPLQAAQEQGILEIEESTITFEPWSLP